MYWHKTPSISNFLIFGVWPDELSPSQDATSPGEEDGHVMLLVVLRTATEPPVFGAASFFTLQMDLVTPRTHFCGLPASMGCTVQTVCNATYCLATYPVFYLWWCFLVSWRQNSPNITFTTHSCLIQRHLLNHHPYWASKHCQRPQRQPCIYPAATPHFPLSQKPPFCVLSLWFSSSEYFIEIQRHNLWPSVSGLFSLSVVFQVPPML